MIMMKGHRNINGTFLTQYNQLITYQTVLMVQTKAISSLNNTELPPLWVGSHNDFIIS